MKTFRDLILWLPKLLLTFFWHLIKGFLQTILLVMIIIVGLIYYANHNDSVLANKISIVTEQVVQLFDSLTQKRSTRIDQEKVLPNERLHASAEEVSPSFRRS
ncbi:hypothetical protein [Streptococcus canis]|uniref:Uncharacterized protein n=1 Tax=Streptococcus canis TaxID=1329 RepID=A0AAE4Q3N1_STRCB|nr:hypothetical protein [Streptococcus canis]MDV5976404.1 hypothetical protein [Streptococcus canis]